MRWRARSIGMAVALVVVGVATMSSPAIPAAAQSVDPPTVTGASPLSGPVAGGTVVTMTGSGFQVGVTEVMVVLTGGGWMREIPASAMTINAEGTTMSFAMPEGPAGGGVAGLVAFVPGKQAANVPTWTYAQLAVTGASPLSGPVSGGTVVTMTGTGFQPGVTEVMVVFTGGLWQQEIPASAMTINAEGTTMSFAMPESPAGAGAAGLVAFVPGIQAKFVPTYTYEPATARRTRVADDGAGLPATGNGTGVLLATATGAVMSGVGLLALARRRGGR